MIMNVVCDDWEELKEEKVPYKQRKVAWVVAFQAFSVRISKVLFCFYHFVFKIFKLIC